MSGRTMEHFMAVSREAIPHVKAEGGDALMQLCGADNIVALSPRLNRQR